MVLSHGLIGEDSGEPKVARTLHKKLFSLKTGKHFIGDLSPIATYPIKIEGGFVYIGFSE